MNLITVEDIATYRPLSSNIPAARVEPFIREAHDLDLRELLGVDLYNKVVEEISPMNYLDLHPYLKPVLCYRAFARFVKSNRITLTSNGVVGKVVEGSQQSNSTDVHAIVSSATEAAMVYEQRLVEFLDANYADYPEWLKCKHSKRSGSIRISAAGNKEDYRDAVADVVNRQSGTGLLYRGKA